jgi:hypothetical protein
MELSELEKNATAQLELLLQRLPALSKEQLGLLLAVSASTASLAGAAAKLSEEPKPEWYTPRRIKFYFIISVAYSILMLTPLAAYLANKGWALALLNSHPIFAALWVAFATLSYPIWTWIEVVAFEKWVRTQPEPRRAIERAYFKINSDLAKNFWTAMFGIYSAAALVGLALKTG